MGGGGFTMSAINVYPQSYLEERLRISEQYSFGNINKERRESILEKKIFIDFRKRLSKFDFSYCTTCNSYDMSDSNKEDCFDNEHPTCGGCL